MGFKGFHESVVPSMTEYLVKQNVAMGRIQLTNDRIFVMGTGRSWVCINAARFF